MASKHKQIELVRQNETYKLTCRKMATRPDFRKKYKSFLESMDNIQQIADALQRVL